MKVKAQTPATFEYVCDVCKEEVVSTVTLAVIGGAQDGAVSARSMMMRCHCGAEYDVWVTARKIDR
jgi:hypothetical protein